MSVNLIFFIVSFQNPLSIIDIEIKFSVLFVLNTEAAISNSKDCLLTVTLCFQDGVEFSTTQIIYPIYI